MYVVSRDQSMLFIAQADKKPQIVFDKKLYGLLILLCQIKPFLIFIPRYFQQRKGTS